jgi:hypothetical protein
MIQRIGLNNLNAKDLETMAWDMTLDSPSQSGRKCLLRSRLIGRLS